MANVAEVNDGTFQAEVLEAAEPVLVDFWAPWCGPCRQLGPVIDQLSKENAGKCKVLKLNVDDSPNIAASLAVSSIPTIMIFKGGQLVDRLVGAHPKRVLQEAIDRAAG